MTTTAARTANPMAVYPVICAVLLVVQLVIHSGVGPFVASRSLLLALLVGLAVAVIGRVALGDTHRGGIFGVLVIMLLVGGTDIRVAILLGSLILLLFAERFLLPERHRPRWHRIGGAVSMVARILVVVVAIEAISVGAIGVWASSVLTEGSVSRPAVASTSVPEDPDIYFILLDGYARSDALAAVFDYDDRSFLSALEARGLHVASASRSNYPLTAQTMASMFHMALLGEIEATAPLLAKSTNRPSGAVIREAINRNPTFDFLRGRGYSITAISSGFEEVAIREADTFVDSGELNEFEIGMLRRTILGDVVSVLAPDFVSSQQRTRIARSFGELAVIAASESNRPRFVFAHIPSPHPPWVYNADGSPRTVPAIDATYADTPAQTGLSLTELRSGYVGAVQFIHSPVIGVIDRIDRASATPPVIVVFSDHGSWIGADGGDVRLRLLNFFAARVPGQPDLFPEDVTLVNVMPTLLGGLFGSDFPRTEPDPSFVYRFGDPYDLIEVPDPNAAIPVGATP